MTPHDIPAGLRLCRASRWNQLTSDWQQLLALNPGGARLALKDGRVVASVAALDYDGRFGWVAMVLVDPAHRRQGLGTAMLTAGLELLEHVPVVRLDATPAGYPIYRARGSRRNTDSCEWSGGYRIKWPLRPLSACGA